MKAPSPLNRQILEEASAWFVDFRVGDHDARARGRFDEWLRRSPEHIRAYMEIAQVYVELGPLSAHRTLDVDRFIAAARVQGNVISIDVAPRGHTKPQALSPIPVAELDASNAVPDRTKTAVQDREATAGEELQTISAALRPAAPARRWPLALAASFILVVTAAISTWFYLNRYPTFTTTIGESRTLTLSDGSTVNLNARSRLRIEFSREERTVELLEGQALFEVTKDAARPFIVRSGDALVRAVGTQFDVNKNSAGTTVTVLEGRVAVLPASMGRDGAPAATARGTAPQELSGNPNPSLDPTAVASDTQPLQVGSPSAGSGEIFVSTGEQVTVTARAVTEVRRADVAAATAWVDHRLIFDASPLSEVAEDFNRYNARPLVIEDPELADFHVSGVYTSTDPASLIRFLREQPGFEVIETEDAVRVRRK